MGGVGMRGNIGKLGRFRAQLSAAKHAHLEKIRFGFLNVMSTRPSEAPKNAQICSYKRSTRGHLRHSVIPQVSSSLKGHTSPLASGAAWLPRATLGLVRTFLGPLCSRQAGSSDVDPAHRMRGGTAPWLTGPAVWMDYAPHGRNPGLPWKPRTRYATARVA